MDVRVKDVRVKDVRVKDVRAAHEVTVFSRCFFKKSSQPRVGDFLFRDDLVVGVGTR
jgi:hypothetical protein